MSTKTIDMTPTWEGILPAMLEAYANLKRQLSTDECDGREDGWCSVHDAAWLEYEDLGDDVSKITRCEIGLDWLTVRKRRDEQQQAITNLGGEFARMAQAADLYNAKVSE